MAGRPGGNTFYLYSEVLEPICRSHLNVTFEFKDLNELYPAYTHALHRKFIMRGFMIKVKELSINNVRHRYYKIGPELSSWYDLNFVSCKGNGKLAKENRKLLALNPVKPIKVSKRIRVLADMNIGNW